MAQTIREVISNPHPDIELGYERGELEYFLTIPDGGLKSDSGLIICTCGYGESADSEYQMNKLRPYLADKYNCLVIGVNYFGIDRRPILRDYSFIHNFCAVYDVPLQRFINNDGTYKFSLDDMFKVIYTTLDNKGVRYLDLRCRPNMACVKEYDSFGFLPAVDNLVVLSHVLKNYKIDQHKMIAFGSSYGGYISALMSKFAPHTFSIVVDNSGFSRANPYELVESQLMSNGHLIKTFKIGDRKHELFGVINHPWTIVDETSPNYFSDSCRSIRSLLVKEHWVPSDTRYYIFHSQEDTVAPIGDRKRMVSVLKDFRQVNYRLIEPEDIDGTIFKNMSHGFNASLRGLFDLVAGQDEMSLAKPNAETDFDMNTSRVLNCGFKSYRFNYSDDYSFSVSIENNQA